MRGLGLALLLAVGCTDTSESTCDTGEQIVMSGTARLASDSAVTVANYGKVVGVNGRPAGNRFYMLDVRDTGADIGTVSDVDVASVPLRFLEGSLYADCTIAGQCSGFFALGGTVHVIETTPTYRATFELTDLYARSDGSNTMGAPIAGTITGCVNASKSFFFPKRNPPEQ